MESKNDVNKGTVSSENRLFIIILSLDSVWSMINTISQ